VYLSFYNVCRSVALLFVQLFYHICHCSPSLNLLQAGSNPILLLHLLLVLSLCLNILLLNNAVRDYKGLFHYIPLLSYTAPSDSSLLIRQLIADHFLHVLSICLTTSLQLIPTAAPSAICHCVRTAYPSCLFYISSVVGLAVVD
jgi:hypothetical protein